jgi:hypothetical protein
MGLALTVLGVYQMINATLWAQGDMRFLLVFLSLGTLFLLNGIPVLIEGAMTMYYGKSKVDPHA